MPGATPARFVAVILLTAAGPASPIAPGRWEITTHFDSATFDGQSDNAPAMPGRSVMICLTPAQADKGPGLASLDDSCTVAASSVGDGRYAYVVNCQVAGSSDRIVTRVAGRYGDTQYDGHTVSLQRRGQMRIEMRSTIAGRRIGECQ